jgi:porin
MSTSFKKVAALLVLPLLVSSNCFALDEEQYNLFPEVGGYRTALEQKGLVVESIITTDVVGNVSGGIKRDAVFLTNYDLAFALDTEKAGLWKGGRAFLYLLGNTGEAPSELIGDLQINDNIEAPESFKVFEAWYEHSFSDNFWAALFGLHDYNGEFYVSEYGLSLIHSSFGIGPELSQISPSIFPTSALGFRLRINPSETSYLLAALYDGVAGNPDNPRGTHIRFDGGDGLFYALEAGVRAGEGYNYYKAAIGFWYHTAEFIDFREESQDTNHGFYALLEKSLLRESEDEAQGLGAFLQLGLTRESRNIVGQYLGAGLSYTGILPGRNSDVTTLGVAHAIASSDYQSTSETIADFETAFELNYKLLITSYFAITPDIQWVINPGATKGIDDALILGLRMELAM